MKAGVCKNFNISWSTFGQFLIVSEITSNILLVEEHCVLLLKTKTEINIYICLSCKDLNKWTAHSLIICKGTTTQ